MPFKRLKKISKTFPNLFGGRNTEAENTVQNANETTAARGTDDTYSGQPEKREGEDGQADEQKRFCKI